MVEANYSANHYSIMKSPKIVSVSSMQANAYKINTEKNKFQENGILYQHPLQMNHGSTALCFIGQ